MPHDRTFDFALAGVSTFRNAPACRRIRHIPRSKITDHENPEFCIKVIDDPADFYEAFAQDLVAELRAAGDHGGSLVLILPAGPMPQYKIAASMINNEKLSLRNVHTFNMDEYANEDGTTAPASWPGSFQYAMWDNFFGRIEPSLRPPASQIHFPTGDVVDRYSLMIENCGGADVCYGGIGWGGHVAFWEPDLAHEFRDDPVAYRQAGSRLVDLHPMTVMQNALHSFGGDWSWVPPRAATIGPRDILGARHRSFWLDGQVGPAISWQRFIARLVAHGPVNALVPGSLLQETRCDYTLLGNVADDVAVAMA